MNVLNETQAAEILAREVAEQLDQGIVPQGKVIFEGKIMERTAVAEIVDNRILEGRKSAYFDIQDTIQDYLGAGPARQRLRSNICFGLRYRVVAAARNVFWGMHQATREASTIDQFNEFLADLDIAENNAEYAHQLGYDEFGTGLLKVKALATIFNEWRNAARADAEALNMLNYSAPDLYEVLEDVQEPQADELSRHLMMARLEFDDEYGATAMVAINNAVMSAKPCPKDCDKDVFVAWSELVEVTRKRIEHDHKERVAVAKAIAPYLQTIIDEAMRVPEPIAFYQLDMQTQQALIEAVDRAAAKIPDQLARDRRIPTSDMAMACVALRKLRARLGEVLRDPRFA